MRFLPKGALIVTLVASAYAQTGANRREGGSSQNNTDGNGAIVSNDTENRASVATALLLTYMANVDGLLRDLADRMRSISEQFEAGELTSLQAQALKLETARSAISRLETISAVYDSVIFSKNENSATPTIAPDDLSDSSPTLILRTRPTVDVRELAHESGR